MHSISFKKGVNNIFSNQFRISGLPEAFLLKASSFLLFYKNTSLLFYCKSPEMLYGLRNIIQLSMGMEMDFYVLVLILSMSADDVNIGHTLRKMLNAILYNSMSVSGCQKIVCLSFPKLLFHSAVKFSLGE